MKPHKVKFIDESLENSFNNLSDKDPIKKGLIKAIRDIKEDFGAGRLITKDTHNKNNIKKILDKHKVDNIRVYNLPSAWRLLYSITRKEDIKIIAVILDWMSHKDYEKLLK
ncbi:MAG: hypothetical protein U9Q06_04180 [Nanoarchaeota archaeon]|nr:hypothetical protein [Nanoarchaeota archaeon]